MKLINTLTLYLLAFSFHNIFVSIIIGLTGNIACGKSLAGEIFKKHGIPVIDSDEIVYEIYKNDKKVQDAILKEFGTLDRREIAKQVFGDTEVEKARRKTLEAIIHPAVDQRLRAWIRENNQARILVNLVPLLFEAKLEERYNYIVTVLADEGLRLERLRIRNPDLSQEEAEKRIKSQMPQEQKAKRSDYILKNNASPEELEEQIIKLLSQLP